MKQRYRQGRIKLAETDLKRVGKGLQHSLGSSCSPFFSFIYLNIQFLIAVYRIQQARDTDDLMITGPVGGGNFQRYEREIRITTDY